MKQGWWVGMAMWLMTTVPGGGIRGGGDWE